MQLTPKDMNKFDLSKKKTFVLVRDLNVAKNLANNDDHMRRKTLKYLKKYLQQRCEENNLTEENLKVLWKGLFFSMWMSDKPLIQEECAENISHLIHCLPFDQAMEFFRIGLTTLENEWFGIDQHRINKFMMLVRRFLRQAFFVLKKYNFKKHHNEAFSRVLENTIFSMKKIPQTGLMMHFIEIYLEELAKVSDGKLQAPRVIDLLQPFIVRLAFEIDIRIIDWINRFIFAHLMKQHNLGLEYNDKYSAWKAHGFAGSINQIQKVIVPNNEVNDEEVEHPVIENKPLDPRAGRVDVELPQIKFNCRDISEMLSKYKNDPGTSKRTRHFLNQWAEKFEKLHKGAYPLGIKTLKSKNDKFVDTNVTKAAKRLIKFEQQLLARDKKTNKRKKGDDEDIESPLTKKKKTNLENNLGEESKIPNKKGDEKSLEEATKAKKDMKHPQKKVKRLKNKKLFNGNKLKRKPSTSLAVSNYDCYFERNSGIWFVSPTDINATALLASNELAEENGHNKNNKVNVASIQVVKEYASKSSEPGNEIGKHEIVPSKNYIKKLKRTKSEAHSEKTKTKLKGKNKANVIAKIKEEKIMPTGPKKVKINTQMNRSADIVDHIMQIRSSPQIPFDSNKKPGKSLLKTPIKSSPINPFYKLGLSDPESRNLFKL